MTLQEQIYANLIALGFDNPSAMAIFDKISQGIGTPLDNTVTEFKNSENRIFNIITTQRYGKSGYYTGKALAFQYGDNLVVDPITLDYVYASIDASRQIISQAAFEELGTGQLFLKIATTDQFSGDLIPLTVDQKDAFNNYFVNFEIPGLPVTIVSNPANVFSFTATATYYATYDLPTLRTNLSTALTNFRKSFQFNGELFCGDLESYVKSNVPGMRDFFVNNTLIDSLPFAGSQNLSAGYFNYISNIMSNITYTPF